MIKIRQITGHEVNECNSAIRIEADERGSGGASHEYTVFYGETVADKPDEYGNAQVISFQNGPIKEVGTNGLTHEVLLTILRDRLASFQGGPYACRENAFALSHIQSALDILHARTLARQERGVEGTHQV